MQNIFQIDSKNTLWQFTGSNNNSNQGWVSLDMNQNTEGIVASNSQLFQFHKDKSIFISTGVPCNGAACDGWILIDQNPATSLLATDSTVLYQMHATGEIYQYTGSPNAGSSVWIQLDGNSSTTAIAAGGGQLYQLHNDNNLWRYTKQPATKQGDYPGWSQLAKPSLGTGVAPQLSVDISTGDLYLNLGQDGIAQLIIAPTAGSTDQWNIPTWNNGTINTLIADNGILYMLMDNGNIMVARKTGNNLTAASIVPKTGAGTSVITDIAFNGGVLYQLQEDGSIYQWVTGASAWTEIFSVQNQLQAKVLAKPLAKLS